MFLKLIELIINFWDSFRPFWVIEQYSEGVLLRLGIFKELLKPGYHWKIPLFDKVIEAVIVTTTMKLSCQSLHTKDDKSVVAEAVIKYKISDTKVALLEVQDPVDAIADMTQAIIKEVIMERPWEEVKSSGIDSLITKKARVEAKKWGIYIEQVTLISLSESPSLRLIGLLDSKLQQG